MINSWGVCKRPFLMKNLWEFFYAKTNIWNLIFLAKVILHMHMSVNFEQARMKNEWVVCKKQPFFRIFFEIFGPQNPILTFYHFWWDHSAHACKIWTVLVKKWTGSLQKSGIFLKKLLDTKTHFWKLMFLVKVILQMPVKFEQALMINKLVVCKGHFFRKFFLRIFDASSHF